MTKTSLLRGLPPTHPGEILREIILPAVDRPKNEIAALLGVSRQLLHAVLSEKKPVSTPMAIRLGKMFGNGPRFWTNLQTTYDLAIAEKRMAAEVEKIPTLEAA